MGIRTAARVVKGVVAVAAAAMFSIMSVTHALAQQTVTLICNLRVAGKTHIALPQSRADEDSQHLMWYDFRSFLTERTGEVPFGGCIAETMPGQAKDFLAWAQRGGDGQYKPGTVVASDWRPRPGMAGVQVADRTVGDLLYRLNDFGGGDMGEEYYSELFVPATWKSLKSSKGLASYADIANRHGLERETRWKGRRGEAYIFDILYERGRAEWLVTMQNGKILALSHRLLSDQGEGGSYAAYVAPPPPTAEEQESRGKAAMGALMGNAFGHRAPPPANPPAPAPHTAAPMQQRPIPPSSASAALPNPRLFLTGTELYSTAAGNFVRFRYDVSNKTAYPAALFASAPTLAPCGKNANASRAWVDFFDATGKRLYGFCALTSPRDLGTIWFAIPRGTLAPEHVYIEIIDRLTTTKYRSNLAGTKL